MNERLEKRARKTMRRVMKMTVPFFILVTHGRVQWIFHGVSGGFYRFKAIADAVSLYFIKVFINYYYNPLLYVVLRDKIVSQKPPLRCAGGGMRYRYLNACFLFITAMMWKWGW